MNLKTAVFFGKIMQNRRQKFLEPHASYTTTITKTASFYPNKEVCFLAKRNIEEGDELTIDYGEGSGKTYKLLNKIVKVSIFCNFSSYFHIFAAVGWTVVMFYICMLLAPSRRWRALRQKRRSPARRSYHRTDPLKMTTMQREMSLAISYKMSRVNPDYR